MSIAALEMFAKIRLQLLLAQALPQVQEFTWILEGLRVDSFCKLNTSPVVYIQISNSIFLTSFRLTPNQCATLGPIAAAAAPLTSTRRKSLALWALKGSSE